MGRKGILEFYPEKAQKFLDALTAGNYACVACDLAGIGESTLYRWLRQGEEDAEADEESLFRQFWESYKKASIAAESRAVTTVRQAAQTDWKAAMTYLERRRPERWGRRDSSHVTQDTTIRFEDLNGDDLTDDQRAAAATLGLCYPGSASERDSTPGDEGIPGEGGG